ncbi:MAG: hypothetical protein WC768_01285 [Patescibacteria group bacterium]|jgi:hypothetical protein
MEEKISKAKYLAITAIVCLVLIFNFLSLASPILGASFGLIYLIFYSFILGSLLTVKKGWQIIFGCLSLFSVISIIGAFLIYTYQFNDYLFILILLLIPAGLFIPYYQFKPKEKFFLKKFLKEYFDKFTERKEPKSNLGLVISYLVLAAINFFLLFKGQTAESIQSPWEVVSPKFFLIYFLATAVLLTYLFRANRTKLPIIILIIHTFLSSSVALIVYKIGYGFDPFIHQATELIIAKTGTINPKPLYYLGQYALVIFLNKLTAVDLALIDRLLVPTLFSLFLPPVIFYVFSQWLKKNYALVLTLSFLTIPYSGFIMTAPQNLANLFFLIAIFLSLLYFRNLISVYFLYLLAAATLVIHPLAGIPLLITVILFNLFKILYHSYIRQLSLYFLAALVFILFLPLAFLVNGSKINWLPQIHRADLYLMGWVDKFDLPLNLAYLVSLNQAVLAALIISLGLFYIAKHKLLKNNAAYFVAALVILADFIIARYFLTFPELNDYDKNFFVQRLIALAFYVLAPFFLIGLYYLIKKFWAEWPEAKAKNWFNKTFIVLILSGVITISLYLSYPRLNQYEPAKFFSLSQSDIKAVNLIEQIANFDHIVLANQMVGVAAIKEFGFKKYYANQFYYSMPMGNPQTFYQAYLDMIYQGTKRQTMEKIMQQANVSEAYFVLNRYWNNAEKIAKVAAANADSVYDIDNGKIYIFKYTNQ